MISCQVGVTILSGKLKTQLSYINLNKANVKVIHMACFEVFPLRYRVLRCCLRVKYEA